MDDPVVVLEGVQLRQGTFLLDIPHWQVTRGGVVGLLGANGAGKSTLLRLLPAIEVPDAGRVRVFGRDPWAHPVEVRSRLGYMTDDLPLFNMRVGPMLRQLSGFYPTWDRALVEELVGRFDLDLGARVQELSKGEGTRLRLVLAAAFRPELLVLDEPATGLDIAGRRAMLATVLEVTQDPRRTVILSSHDLVDVERVVDRLVLLEEGRIVAEGAVGSLVAGHPTLEEALVARGWAR